MRCKRRASPRRNELTQFSVYVESWYIPERELEKCDVKGMIQMCDLYGA